MPSEFDRSFLSRPFDFSIGTPDRRVHSFLFMAIGSQRGSSCSLPNLPALILSGRGYRRSVLRKRADRSSFSQNRQDLPSIGRWYRRSAKKPAIRTYFEISSCKRGLGRSDPCSPILSHTLETVHSNRTCNDPASICPFCWSVYPATYF